MEAQWTLIPNTKGDKGSFREKVVHLHDKRQSMSAVCQYHRRIRKYMAKACFIISFPVIAIIFWAPTPFNWEHCLWFFSSHFQPYLLTPVLDLSLTRTLRPIFSELFSSLKSRSEHTGRGWAEGRSIAPDLKSIFFSFSLAALVLPALSHGVNKGSFSFLPTNHLWHELGNLVYENQPVIF